MGKANYFSDKEIEVLKTLVDFATTQLDSDGFDDQKSFNSVTTKVSKA